MQRLQSHGVTDGMFLVRQRGTDYSLSVCSGGRAVNFLIKFKKGIYSMGDKFPTFGSLDSLVKHFSSDHRAGLPTRLITPCPVPSGAGGAGDYATGSSSGRKNTPLTKKEAAAKKMRRQERRDRLMKEQLASLPQFPPYWTKGTAYLMFAVLVVEIWQSWDPAQPLTKISFKPVVTLGSPPIGISEDRSETFEKVVPTNFLIGPSAADLVFYGAKYGPCKALLSLAGGQFYSRREMVLSDRMI